MTKRMTFPVDNAALQIAPDLFAASRRKSSAIQPYLPGLDKPLPPFAEWLLYGIYSLIDPNNPAAVIQTTPTELLRIMEFSQEAAAEPGHYPTYSSDQYQLINESLDLLFTTEIQNITKGPWKRYHPKDENEKVKKDKKDKKNKKSDEYTFVFRGHVLSNFTIIYPPEVTPAENLPEDEVENISRSESGSIKKRKEGPRPIGIELQLDPRLIRGLTGHPDNIGTTSIPFDVFKIRKAYPKNRSLHRLLFYVLRTTEQTLINQDLDKLINRLGLDTRRVGRTRKDVLTGFQILKDTGVIFEFRVNTEDTSGKVKFSFIKSKDWYLKDWSNNPELPGEEGKEAGPEGEL